MSQQFPHRKSRKALWHNGLQEKGKGLQDFSWSPFLEQGTGIEPASSAWEADVLPMY